MKNQTEHHSRGDVLRGGAAFVLGAGIGLSSRPGAFAQAPSLRVGAGLIEAQAQAYFAQDAGMFKQQRLDVEVITSANGAATAAAVASGDLQIGVTSVLGLAQAHLRGLPFVILAPGGIHDTHFATNGILVAPDSKIFSGKDLNGKTVAVATLNGLDQLLVTTVVDKAGGDVSSLKFTEIKPVLMLDALLAGRIDAASMEDPELGAARSRTRSLGDAEDAIAKRFVETVWFTTTDWLAKNDDVAHRFRAAIFAAGSWAMANEDQAGTILQQRLHVTQGRGEQRYATHTDVAEIQVLIDAAVKYKVVAAPVNAADFIWTAK